ncbi:hypothetical protein B7463_g6134, partial [Scytalidium lignicola]
MYRSVASLVAIAAAVNAATIDIAVGQTGLVMSPNSVRANVGDVLQFHFYPGGHSVVQGDFANPCLPSSSNAFFSGYINGDANGTSVFLVNVANTDPIWFYCSLGEHCPAGMVGVVNAPSNQTINDFRTAAQNAGTVRAPASVQGGTVTTVGAANGTSSGAGGAATSSASAQATGAVSSSVIASITSTPASTTGSGSSATAASASATPNTASRVGDFAALLCLTVVGGLFIALG